MRGLLAALLIGCLTSHCGADEPNPEIGGKLTLTLGNFCISSMLHDRGMARCAFNSGANQWILERLLPEKEFVNALDGAAIPADLKLLIPQAKTEDALLPNRDGYLRLMDVDRQYAKELAAKLSDEQRAKLIGVYLHIDGLSALCRPEFVWLFEDEQKRKTIAGFVDQAWSQAAPIHRTAFSHDVSESLESYQVGLRQVVVELDLRIAQELSEVEKQRLSGFIAATKSIGQGIVLESRFDGKAVRIAK